MTSINDKTDNELAVLAARGNEEAFRSILKRYRNRIIGICLKMLRNLADAEDAAQDSFVKIYNHLKDFDPERSFAAWAARITINECRDRLRKRARFKMTFSELTDKQLAVSRSPETDNLELKNKLDRVEKAINSLPEKLREVLILKVYSEYSYDEIAGCLKIKTGTVMSRLSRAREKLSEMLKMDINND